MDFEHYTANCQAAKMNEARKLGTGDDNVCRCFADHYKQGAQYKSIAQPARQINR